MEVRGNKLYWAKVKPDAIIPTKERENAGYDIYPCFDKDYMVIPKHETVLIPIICKYKREARPAVRDLNMELCH